MKAYAPLIVAGAAVLSGCGAAEYKAKADKEVYEIIRRKQEAALGIRKDFTIDQEQANPLVGLPLVQPELLGDVQAPPSVMLSLPQALEIAATDNREYQGQKEDVYGSALSLTQARYEWGPIFSGDASAAYTKTPGDETAGGRGGLGVSKVFADGTRLVVGLSSTLLMHLVQNPREAASSLISATLTKPLWRGAGKKIAQENLLQAERNAVYAIRSFARYRKTFAVRLAREYYGVLRGRDTVLNAWRNYQNLIDARERTRMMAEAGRLPRFQVDQAEQDELRAKDIYVRAVRRYQQSIDQFKITLALPTDEAVLLDPKELDVLRERGIIHPDIPADRAVAVALKSRLDLENSLDSVTDAGRKIVLAENGIAPDVTLVLKSSVPTSGNRPNEFRTDFGTYSADIRIDLPLDRLQERNSYRSRLIDLERRKRAYGQQEDSVKLEVRDAWRKLQEAKASHDIQQKSLKLATLRVESATLLLQAGRAVTRDLLEAQEALLEAENAVTRALIDHTIARLEFWRDIGVLEVSENGLWKEDYDLGEE